MNDYQNPDPTKSNGALFPNKFKQGQNHPDIKGELEITGEQVKLLIEMNKKGIKPVLQIAGWYREKGELKYTSIEAQAYIKQDAQQPPPSSFPDYDDDVPF